MKYSPCVSCGNPNARLFRCWAHSNSAADTERVTRALIRQRGQILTGPIPPTANGDPAYYEVLFRDMRRRGDWPESLPVPRDIREELGLDRAPIRKESQ